MRSLREITAALLGGVAAVLVMTTAAQAYVGPGSGLAALGTLAALVGTVVMAIFGFVWFPIKRLLKRRAKGDASSENPASR